MPTPLQIFRFIVLTTRAHSKSAAGPAIEPPLRLLVAYNEEALLVDPSNATPYPARLDLYPAYPTTSSFRHAVCLRTSSNCLDCLKCCAPRSLAGNGSRATLRIHVGVGRFSFASGAASRLPAPRCALLRHLLSAIQQLQHVYGSVYRPILFLSIQPTSRATLRRQSASSASRLQVTARPPRRPLRQTGRLGRRRTYAPPLMVVFATRQDLGPVALLPTPLLCPLLVGWCILLVVPCFGGGCVLERWGEGTSGSCGGESYGAACLVCVVLGDEADVDADAGVGTAGEATRALPLRIKMAAPSPIGDSTRIQIQSNRSGKCPSPLPSSWSRLCNPGGALGRDVDGTGGAGCGGYVGVDADALRGRRASLLGAPDPWDAQLFPFNMANASNASTVSSFQLPRPGERVPTLNACRKRTGPHRDIENTAPEDDGRAENRGMRSRILGACICICICICDSTITTEVRGVGRENWPATCFLISPNPIRIIQRTHERSDAVRGAMEGC
ncbi:hypothetical protein C8R45DRAFT_1091766 [Mycena sanguinolenta]|nr:hypothetical protein C8R45DRAFT_1091766 [Mycena sanguinolenta]